MLEYKDIEQYIPDNYIKHIFDKVGYYGARIIIMDKDGKAYIILTIHIKEPNILHISELHVNKEHRNKGIAKSLITIAENIANGLNLNSIMICTLVNDWVHNWYNHLGFKDNYIDSCDSNFIWLIKNLKYDTV